MQNICLRAQLQLRSNDLNAAMNNSVSAINVTNGFTLNGTAYREGFSAETISASAISISFGDLADYFFASAVTGQNFTFAGGDGNFSAAMTNVIIEDADWSLTMPELGNGLTITNLQFSASGTTVQTPDNVSASSTTAAGDTLKFEFNMGEDNVQDDVGQRNSGKSLVKILNFKTGTISCRQIIRGVRMQQRRYNHCCIYNRWR